MIALDLNAFDIHSVAQISAARIADCLVEGSIIALAAGALLRATHRLTSATRFLVCFSAMMAIAAVPLAGVTGWTHGGVNSIAVAHPALVLPGSWALYIFGAWMAVTIILLGRVAVGVLHVFHVRRSCVPLDPALVDCALRETLRGGSRRVELCASDLVSVPTAIGFVRPAVVLPHWLIGELSAVELKQLVLHELAHLRRWDDWTNLAQQIVKALLFFHPAVWWIESRVSLEREMACDDAVVAETANPRAYAECLARLAEKSMIRRSLALAQAALGRVRQTSSRVAQLLRRDRPVACRHSWIAATIAAGFVLVSSVTVSRMPQLVAFAPDQVQIAGTRSWPVPQISVTPQDVAAKPPVTLPVVAASMRSKPRSIEVANARKVAASDDKVRFAVLRKESRPQTALVQPARWSEASNAAPVAQPAVQNVYFVIESRDYLPSGVVFYRTTVWRVIVTSQTDNPSTRIPRNET
jgi:beta-lactamase regulating signal transducer with metallopeptidase domain